MIPCSEVISTTILVHQVRLAQLGGFQCGRGILPHALGPNRFNQVYPSGQLCVRVLSSSMEPNLAMENQCIQFAAHEFIDRMAS